jgi:hypothetical protein
MDFRYRLGLTNRFGKQAQGKKRGQDNEKGRRKGTDDEKGTKRGRKGVRSNTVRHQTCWLAVTVVCEKCSVRCGDRVAASRVPDEHFLGGHPT